ncbi:MAG: hypothetical protein Cons2KO_30120 [Congregibacter sp.]
MILSLVVCTRNRARQLQAALASLDALVFDKPWELIIVDNGSTDETPEILGAFAAESQQTVVLEHEPKPGLSKARNRGLSKARGELVAFTDDDCYPNSDYLQRLFFCFSGHDVAFAGGRVLLFDEKDLQITIQELNEGVSFQPGSFFKAGVVHGANMAFRRSVLLDLRGFDERLGAGARFKAAEDTDAMIRCSLAGYSGVYDPTIVVQHHHGRRSTEEADSLRRSYAIGRGACMVKHALNPVSRSVYAKNWYWQLRLQKPRESYRELWSAIRFMILFGLLPSKVSAHPSDSLSLRSS